MKRVFKNNSQSTLAAGIGSGDISMTIAAGTGTLFPVLTTGQSFYATLTDAATKSLREIVLATATATDTFTITRAQQGTSARAYLAGDTVELLITADLGNNAAFIDQLNKFALGIQFNDNTVIETANSLGFRNRIINGNMEIAQRASTATVTAGTAVPTASTGYPCVDRHYVYSTGANVTAAQIASGANKRLQITGAASVTAVGVGHRIESLYSKDMAGSTCTLSVKLSNSLLTTVTWTAYYATSADTFGTVGTPTKTQIATGTFTINAVDAMYSAQIAVPSAATTGIEIVLTVGAQISGTWTIGEFQFEKGAITTPAFEYFRPIELELCQRYAEQIGGGGASARYPVAGGYAGGAGQVIYGQIVFATTKRIVPTIADPVGADGITNCSYSLDGASKNGCRIVVSPGAAGAFMVYYAAQSIYSYAEIA